MENRGLVFKAGLFKVIGDPNRLKILELLREGPLCQCEIIPILGQSQPTVSRHLRLLEKVGLLVKRREGVKTFYRIVDPHLYGLLDVIDEKMEELITEERTKKLYL